MMRDARKANQPQKTKTHEKSPGKKPLNFNHRWTQMDADKNGLGNKRKF